MTAPKWHRLNLYKFSNLQTFKNQGKLANYSLEITIDATNQPLGRLAGKVAVLLRGKNNPGFRPYIISQNRVVVFNTDGMKFTGKKIDQKVYYHYSGYHGGLKKRTLRQLFEIDSRLVLKKAIFGMLPKNKHRNLLLKQLTMYKGDSR